jgi:hypothetical protein
MKGAITVPTEYFKYYHATCSAFSSALPKLASCINNTKFQLHFFGICYKKIAANLYKLDAFLEAGCGNGDA